MSNHHTATFGHASMPQPARGAAARKPSFLRGLLQAWLRAYGNRVDADGNVVCEH